LQTRVGANFCRVPEAWLREKDREGVWNGLGGFGGDLLMSWCSSMVHSTDRGGKHSSIQTASSETMKILL